MRALIPIALLLQIFTTTYGFLYPQAVAHDPASIAETGVTLCLWVYVLRNVRRDA